MVKMTCPMTGTVLHVDESRVEKYEKAGYKRVVAEKPKRVTKKSE